MPLLIYVLRLTSIKVVQCNALFRQTSPLLSERIVDEKPHVGCSKIIQNLYSKRKQF